MSVLQAQKLACTVLKPAEKPAAGASGFATNLSTDFLPIMKPQGEQDFTIMWGFQSMVHDCCASTKSVVVFKHVRVWVTQLAKMSTDMAKCDRETPTKLHSGSPYSAQCDLCQTNVLEHAM